MRVDVFHEAQEDVTTELHPQEGLVYAFWLEKDRSRTQV
jgi:hypothetical protein